MSPACAFSAAPASRPMRSASSTGPSPEAAQWRLPSGRNSSPSRRSRPPSIRARAAMGVRQDPSSSASSARSAATAVVVVSQAMGASSARISGIVRPALDAQRALRHGGEHGLHRQDAAGHGFEAEALKPGQRQQGRVALARFELAHPRVRVAAQGHDLQVRPVHQHLRRPAQRRGADPRALGQVHQRLGMGGEEGVARVVALEDAGDGEALGQPRLHVLHRMDGDIHLVRVERLLQLLGEQALAADLGERPVEDLVGHGGDDDEFGLQAGIGGNDAVADHARLGQGHREPRVPMRRGRFSMGLMCRFSRTGRRRDLTEGHATLPSP